MAGDPGAHGEKAAAVLAEVRRRRPLVHHITNAVTINDAANITLLVGARPVMGVDAEEVGELAGEADALVLNTGTPTAELAAAMVVAGQSASAADSPVILDPVGVGATMFRADLVEHLLDEVRVTVVRGNAAEIGFLAGTGSRMRGVDAEVEAEANDGEPIGAARELAGLLDAVVAATGARDVVTDGARAVAVANGHPLLTSITGAGCMATTVVACCAAVEADPLVAAAAGLAAFGLAAERAAAGCSGPGSFKVALFDALAALTAGDLAAGARIEPLGP
jgi:hydroxyethylthiazole kinase